MVALVTQQRLRELVHYDPVTGHFVSRVDSCRRKAGARLGSNNGNGYLRINIDGRMYYAHRLAWFYCYGQWPQVVDHIDGNLQDNRISKLRAGVASQNVANSKLSKANKSGSKGVSLDRRGRWRATITHNRRQIHLGTFTTKAAAATAYLKAAAEIFGEFGTDGTRKPTFQ